MNQSINRIILTVAFMVFTLQAFGQTAFSGAGLVESTSGGFKFPNGTIQTSASTDSLSELVCEAGQVVKFDGANWICSSDEVGSGLDGLCTAITSLPHVIDSEGVYCFTGNLQTSMTTGNAISITADNVIVDLNGWNLDGSGAGADTITRGINAYQRNNITIRNGTIRGFYIGINFTGAIPYTASKGYLVEEIRAIANTYRGFVIEGSDSTVRNNNVLNTGGSTQITYAEGMRLRGPGLRLLNNDINDLVAYSTGNANGVILFYGDGAVIEGNRIFDLSTDTGYAFGIYISVSDDVLVKNNSVSRLTRGIFFNESSALVVENQMMNMDRGIWYNNSTGKYRDNLTFNVATPFTNGTDSGGND